LLFAETPKSKIHSFKIGGFPQSNALFYNCLVWAFAAAALAVEWFFIAALSAAMKKTYSFAFSVPQAKRAVIPQSRTYPA
jgi:hypothetical protein